MVNLIAIASGTAGEVDSLTTFLLATAWLEGQPSSLSRPSPRFGQAMVNSRGFYLCSNMRGLESPIM